MGLTIVGMFMISDARRGSNCRMFFGSVQRDTQEMWPKTHIYEIHKSIIYRRPRGPRRWKEQRIGNM